MSPGKEALMAEFMLEMDNLYGTNSLRQSTVVRLIIHVFINSAQTNRQIIRPDTVNVGAR